jgi:hypothetical protein
MKFSGIISDTIIFITRVRKLELDLRAHRFILASLRRTSDLHI